MEPFAESQPPLAVGPFSSAVREIGVHVVSEHVFCPRAGILALESGPDVGDEEPQLGPRLDWFADYDEHRFVEELRAAWGECRLWLTLLPAAVLLVVAVWRLVSPLAGIAAALPLFYGAARLWDILWQIRELVRERNILRAAPEAVDVTSTEIRQINWWSLRKAGFDCRKPVDAHHDPVRRVVGQPWRVLTKDTTVRIPVVRKHRGEPVCRPQHIVRVAAYCQLLKTCELADAPFGLLMFAGSYDCLAIPHTAGAQLQFEKAVEDVREFLRACERGTLQPTAPTDDRCSGCHLGHLREHVAGRTDTILNGKPVAPFLIRSPDDRLLHCTCGDRFKWIPPHDATVRLGLAARNEATS